MHTPSAHARQRKLPAGMVGERVAPHPHPFSLGPYPSGNEAGCDDDGNDGQQQESQPPVLDEADQKPSKERCHPLNQYDQFVTNASMDLVYAPGKRRLFNLHNQCSDSS